MKQTDKNTYLIFGANGQVGWELQRALAPMGQVLALFRQDVDVSDVQSVRKAIRETQPTVVVNAAAYTSVDKAESDANMAWRVNAEAVSAMSEEVRSIGGWLVHYSTDYVFDGSKDGAYVETDLTSPLSIYGKTKLEGEEMVRTSGCRHLIFRTSWVYASRGGNFAKTMLRLAQDKDELKVVADQVGVPTSAELITDVTALILYLLRYDSPLAQECSGTYNLVAAGETNWQEYASFVLEKAMQHGIKLKVTPDKVQAITTEEYLTPARRPLNSRLDTQKLCDTFGLVMPDWKVHVARMIDEVIQQ